MNTSGNDSNKPTLFQVIGSVLAAGFGVQNSKNRERDFQDGNWAIFLVVGIIATALFVLLVYSVVRLVLA